MSKKILYILLIIVIILIIAVGFLIVKDLNIENFMPLYKKAPKIPDVSHLQQKKVSADAPVVEPVKPKTPVQRKIKFQYRNSRPSAVLVLGEFNDWTPLSMIKGENHIWSVTVEISPGEYLYCFDIDGRLIPDPNNPNVRILPGDEKRSVLNVKPISP